MTIEYIERLVAKDESRHLELKKTTGEFKDGMHSACAFLNTEGGWLIFGVIALRFDGWVRGQQPFTFHGCPYWKVESTTMVMPREIFEERIRTYKPQQYSWEKIMADSLTVSDLDENRIRGLVRLGVEGGRMPETAMYEPIENILRKSELLVNGRPNNGCGTPSIGI
ncbi:MAG: ATP-binding protein [Bacteroidales bacterium]|nr:ATP-binding protein [Bacteroidales bacterium]